MSQSMTGYGQAKTKIGKREFLIEFRSVNHRHLDLSVRLPSGLSAFESEIRQLIADKVKRGKINAYLGWNGESENELEVDAKRVKQYIASLRRIGKLLKLDPSLSVSDLVGLPNIFTTVAERAIDKRDWPAIRRATEKALTGFIQMRTREGSGHVSDIKKRLTKIEGAIQTIKQRAHQVPDDYKQKLTKRIQELTSAVELDQKALSREVAFFADRSDITEELVRLDHHIKFFRKTLDEHGEIGKRLDFISQEIHRETNTIASKSSSFPIAKDVITIKAEVEKIREQVQNIE